MFDVEGLQERRSIKQICKEFEYGVVAGELCRMPDVYKPTLPCCLLSLPRELAQRKVSP